MIDCVEELNRNGVSAMRKVEMAEWLAKQGANGDRKEETRIYRHHMGRTIDQVRESYQRQKAIAETSDAECRLHCDVSFIK
jgi:hypothetical protein